MLAKRIIPTLLYRGTTLVKGKQFNSWRSVGNVQQAARIYAQRGVDELIILDIEATAIRRCPDFELVGRICEDNFCPITVGGGVRSVSDVRELLNVGADKVSICTAALVDLNLITECANKYGNQAIVVSMDCKGKGVYINCGKKCLGHDPVIWAKTIEEMGAGEILLTNIDREGTMEGYDLDLISDISSAVSIPVIAHGGCGSYLDMMDAIDAGADAVAAGSLFQFTDDTPNGAAEFLFDRGYEVRI